MGTYVIIVFSFYMLTDIDTEERIPIEKPIADCLLYNIWIFCGLYKLYNQRDCCRVIQCSIVITCY